MTPACKSFNNRPPPPLPIGKEISSRKIVRGEFCARVEEYINSLTVPWRQTLLFGTLALTVTVKADWTRYPYLFDPFVAEDREMFTLLSAFAENLEHPKSSPLTWNATLEHAMELFEAMRNPDYRIKSDHEDFVNHQIYFNHNTRRLEFVEDYKMSRVKQQNTLTSLRLLFHIMREDILRNIDDKTLRERMTRAIGSFDDNHYTDVQFWQVLSALQKFVLLWSSNGNWDFLWSPQIKDSNDDHIYTYLDKFRSDLRIPAPTPADYNRTLERGMELLVKMRDPHYRIDFSDMGDFGKFPEFRHHVMIYDYKIDQLQHPVKYDVSNAKEEEARIGFTLLFNVFKADILRDIQDETLRKRMEEAIGSYYDNYYNDLEFWQVLSGLRDYILRVNDSNEWDFLFSDQIKLEYGEKTFKHMFHDLRDEDIVVKLINDLQLSRLLFGTLVVMGNARDYDDDSIPGGIRKVRDVPKKKFLEQEIDFLLHGSPTTPDPNARVLLIKQFDKELRNPKPTPLEYTKTLEHGIELLEAVDIDYKLIRNIFTTKELLLNEWLGWRFVYIMMGEEILKRIEDETLRERMTRTQARLGAMFCTAACEACNGLIEIQTLRARAIVRHASRAASSSALLLPHCTVLLFQRLSVRYFTGVGRARYSESLVIQPHAPYLHRAESIESVQGAGIYTARRTVHLYVYIYIRRSSRTSKHQPYLVCVDVCLGNVSERDRESRVRPVSQSDSQGGGGGSSLYTSVLYIATHTLRKQVRQDNYLL
ncbi:unnamed protein product [Trichogramma brassicae]|uniref:Uncharacterized protein n=1 Tax=Trichogramma brassicae TaxID=86971 RepID=A0A6H5J556_9HYME|nr:unnamed protein product [Trichogramma brassicae]